MVNVFQLAYESRLQDWFLLRESLKNCDIQEKCVKIDAWWQRAPLVNHYLHPDDIENWPGPWELIQDNSYCLIARGLGIYYTLILTGVDAKDVDFLIGTDDNNEDAVLITVDNAKYILNWYPDSVISISLRQFKIDKTLKVNTLADRIK